MIKNSNNQSIEFRFDTMRRRIAKFGINKYEAKIAIARDKQLAREYHLCSILNYDFAKLTEDEQLIISPFDYSYRLGYSVDKIFYEAIDRIAETIKGMNESRDYIKENKDNYYTKEDLDAFDNRIIERIETFNSYSDENKLLRFFALNYAMIDIRDYFMAQKATEPKLNNEIKVGTPRLMEICWTGNKIDFTKLIYGLYHAGLINNGDSEVTKIVETLAYHFNIKIGEGWKADLSNSKSRANIDTDHGKVFDKGKQALLKYINGEKSLKNNSPNLG